MSKKEHAADITAKLQLGLAEAYRTLLAFKKYKQSPVIISRGGQIVAVAPEDMPPARPLAGAEPLGK